MGGLAGLAVAALVVGNDPVPAGQAVDLMLPARRGLAPAVDQDDGPPVAGLGITQFHAVVGADRPVHRLASAASLTCPRHTAMPSIRHSSPDSKLSSLVRRIRVSMSRASSGSSLRAPAR